MSFMAKQTQKANNKPKTSSYRTFLCCFGSSEDDDTMSPPSKATGNRKRNRWFFWSLKVNSSAVKTVAVVDLTNFSGKASSKDKTDVPPPSKSKSSKPAVEKVTKKRRAMFSCRKAPSLSPAAATEPPDQKPPKQQTERPAQNTVLEKRRVSDTRNKTTGQKQRTFSRKTDVVRTRSSSQPGSPVEDNTQHNKPSSTIRIGRAMSHPAATNSRRPAQTEIDPVVGMSIILVTLMIMLVWGRVCAILSTSAWFYIIPRLSKSTKSSDRKHGDNNNNHQNGPFWDEQGLTYEYKKRVVLEGFLDRDHHR